VAETVDFSTRSLVIQAIPARTPLIPDIIIQDITTPMTAATTRVDIMAGLIVAGITADLTGVGMAAGLMGAEDTIKKAPNSKLQNPNSRFLVALKSHEGGRNPHSEFV
jgi:hypothetical protein